MIEQKDIVERLRQRHTCRHGANGPVTVHQLNNPDGPEAADTIEFLRRHIAELEARVEEDDARWSQLTIRAAQTPPDNPVSGKRG